MAEYHHAVIRDLNQLGYRGDTPITLSDFVSIVLASPPDSAVRYFLEGGWSQTDQLLANLGEQQAGLTALPRRYDRPGITEAPDPGPVAVDGAPNFTAAATGDEFHRRLAEARARAAGNADAEQKSAS